MKSFSNIVMQGAFEANWQTNGFKAWFILQTKEKQIFPPNNHYAHISHCGTREFHLAFTICIKYEPSFSLLGETWQWRPQSDLDLSHKNYNNFFTISSLQFSRKYFKFTIQYLQDKKTKLHIHITHTKTQCNNWC